MMQVHGLLPVHWYHDIWTVQFSLLFVSCVHGGNLAAMPRALLLSVCPALVVISKEKQSCLLRRHPKNRLVMLWTPVIQRGQRAKKSLQDFYQSSGLYLAAGLPSPSKALGPCKKKKSNSPWKRHGVGAFAIFTEKDLGEKRVPVAKSNCQNRCR